MDPREIAGASLGVWVLSDIAATVTGVSGAVIALGLCLLVAAIEVGRSRSMVRALALVATLFTSASGSNAIASSHAVAVAAAHAQESPEPTPEPVVEPWW